MLKVAMFLGVCIVIYAIFSYLETKLRVEQDFEISQEFIRQYGDELLPEIIEDVNENVTSFLIGYIYATNLGEVVYESNKEEVSETGTEDNKKFTRD